MRNLLSLSWPMIITNSLMMLGPTIDMVWVGRLGAASVAGVGIAGMAVQCVNAARMGLNNGTKAMIARFVGAGDIEGANNVTQQAFVISAAFSILLAIIGVFLSEPILVWMGVEPDVVTEGAVYMRIMFVGSIAMSFRMMTEGVMQASGDTVAPMKITIFYRLFHIAICPFLVFGWWIFPQLGVTGAALANVVSQTLGVAAGLWILISGRTRLLLSFRNFRINGNIMWRIVKIGIPATIMSVEMSLSQIILMWFIVPFGTLAVAAHSINQRIEMVILMPAMAFGMTAGVLAGQNLGAGQPERAEKTAWRTVALVEGFIIICIAVILIWAEGIVGIFSPDPELVALGAIFLKISLAGFLVVGFFATFMQCLAGVGDTLPPMIIGLSTGWMVRIPLAYYLPKITDLGVYGVRWAMVAAMVVGAISYTTYFRLGRWKRKQV